MLEQLVYVSRARDALSSVLSVSDILEQARRNNSRDGVTGALAFTQTHFLQLIEGEPSRLDDLVARLHRDERHSDIRIIDRISITARAFEGWAMVTPRFTPHNTRLLAQLIEDAPTGIPAYRERPLTLIVEQDEGLSAT